MIQIYINVVLRLLCIPRKLTLCIFLFQLIVDLADSDNSSVEEFEDASETFTEDDIFVDVETKRMQPLSMLEQLNANEKEEIITVKR